MGKGFYSIEGRYSCRCERNASSFCCNCGYSVDVRSGGVIRTGIGGASSTGDETTCSGNTLL